jgi:hypothetical protein
MNVMKDLYSQQELDVIEDRALSILSCLENNGYDSESKKAKAIRILKSDLSDLGDYLSDSVAITLAKEQGIV